MTKSKKLLAAAGVALSLAMLTIPASAHHGGGHHHSSGVTATAYCTVCQENHTKSQCPNFCGDCNSSHTGDCTKTAYHSGHHHAR